MTGNARYHAPNIANPECVFGTAERAVSQFSGTPANAGRHRWFQCFAGGSGWEGRAGPAGRGLRPDGTGQPSLHAPWGAVMPVWLRGAQARAWLGAPRAPLIPYAAGLALHGAAMLVFNRRTSPENRG